jgi:hypothetical protein
MRKYHLLRANCQTFAWETIQCTRSNAATYTKHITRTSYAERFCHQVHITPLHTFILIATSVACTLLSYCFRLLMGSWYGCLRGSVYVQPGSLTITDFMQFCTVAALAATLVDYGKMGGHTTIGSFVVRKNTLKLQLATFLAIVNTLAYLLQQLKTMVPDLSNQDMAPFQVLMPVACFHSFRLVNHLKVSIDSALEARADLLRGQTPSEKDYRRQHISGDSSDESETHDGFGMRSSYAGQTIDKSDRVPALPERAIWHSMVRYNSIAKSQYDCTHSGANKNIGIAHKPVQCGQPKKNQEQSPDIGNRRADAMEVTAEVAQPLSEQADMVVRRRPRQRQRVIVLDVDEDTTASE